MREDANYEMMKLMTALMKFAEYADNDIGDENNDG